jgi:glycosyltransferase involved in cell wall biosynthesis
MSRVSIITPAYNSLAFLPQTIDSVRAQTFQNWEHIVVDDGSTDGTAEVLRTRLQDEDRTWIICQQNAGQHAARNHGARLSDPESDYLLFLDADDMLAPEMLERMVSYLDNHPDAAMAHCQFRMIDESGSPMAITDWHRDYGTKRFVPTRFSARKLTPETPVTPFVSLYAGFHFIIPSISVIRRSVYDRLPPWNEHFGVNGDLNFFWRLALVGDIHFLDEELVFYRRHPEQISNSSLDDTKKELYRQWDILSEDDALSTEQRAAIADAQVFKDGKLIPYWGFQSGTRELQSGNWASAARCYGGALRQIAKALFV